MAKDIGNTASYGNGAYQVPQDDDAGAVVFSILEDFMERMATHTHIGNDSATIAANFDKIHRIITPTWSAHTFGAESLAEGESTGIKKCTIAVSSVEETDATKLHTSATLDRDVGDMVDWLPVFSFYYKELDPATVDKFYWQQFHPDWIWSGDRAIDVFSNVAYDKVRVVQY